MTHKCYDVCTDGCPAAEASILASQRVKHHQMACHRGFTIAFDNIDVQISRTNMTMSKQNRDVHWVNHNLLTRCLEMTNLLMALSVTWLQSPIAVSFQVQRITNDKDSTTSLLFQGYLFNTLRPSNL